MVCPGPADWGSDWASFRSSVEAATMQRAQGLGRKTKNSGRSAWGEERRRWGRTHVPARGPPNIFRTTSTCHCPFVPLPCCPCATPVSPPKGYTQHKHTPTYKQTHWEPTATTAIIPDDFRCLDWQETGRVRTTSCEYGKRQKIIENLAFMNVWWESGGWRGLCLWLNQSIACVVCVCVTANRGWDKQGLDQAQTTANPAVGNICPCN